MMTFGLFSLLCGNFRNELKAKSGRTGRVCKRASQATQWLASQIFARMSNPKISKMAARMTNFSYVEVIVC